MDGPKRPGLWGDLVLVLLPPHAFSALTWASKLLISSKVQVRRSWEGQVLWFAWKFIQPQLRIFLRGLCLNLLTVFSVLALLPSPASLPCFWMPLFSPILDPPNTLHSSFNCLPLRCPSRSHYVCYPYYFLTTSNSSPYSFGSPVVKRLATEKDTYK